MQQIKETQIMIGNYLFASDQQIHRVSKFDDKTIWFEKTINRHGVSCWLTSKISECISIPLTEDILLKCGAKRIEDNKVALILNDPSTHLILMKIGTHWYPQIEQTGEFISDGVNTVCLNFIDYVHQLQNLFKTLTQNDLKVEV